MVSVSVSALGGCGMHRTGSEKETELWTLARRRAGRGCGVMGLRPGARLECLLTWRGLWRQYLAVYQLEFEIGGQPGDLAELATWHATGPRWRHGRRQKRRDTRSSTGEMIIQLRTTDGFRAVPTCLYYRPCFWSATPGYGETLAWGLCAHSVSKSCKSRNVCTISAKFLYRCASRECLVFVQRVCWCLLCCSRGSQKLWAAKRRSFCLHCFEEVLAIAGLTELLSRWSNAGRTVAH